MRTLVQNLNSDFFQKYDYYHDNVLLNGLFRDKAKY